MKLFEEMKKRDIEFDKKMLDDGKVDIFEISRMAHFHGVLMPPRLAIHDNKALHEAIQIAFDKTQTFHDDESAARWSTFITDLTEFLVGREFKAYWDLKPEEEIQALAKHDITTYEQNYKNEMVEARAAVYGVLTNDMTYSAHVKDIAVLDHLLNQKMMDKDSLPSENPLEGLMILRSAWDVVDIAHYVLRGYKLLAKVLFLHVIIFAVVNPSVIVFQKDIDGSSSIQLVDGSTMSASQFIIFIVSTITAFVTAIMAFFNPLRRWQQIRDAESAMLSAIWQYRTRTGAYVCSRSGDSRDANIALREQVLVCRQKILGQADMKESSFYKQYPSSIYTHGQRTDAQRKNGNASLADTGSSSKGNNKVHDEAEQSGHTLDLEAPDSRFHMGLLPDNHHSPVTPDDYIRMRLFSIMDFYRQRLPRYSAFWERCRFLVMSGAVISATISYLGFHEKVAIVSAATAGISAWLEWSGISRKVARYNASIVDIENLILWWDSMSTVEKSSPLVVEHLVAAGEAIINNERGSWLSAPGKDKKDDKKDKNDKQKESKKEG